MGLEPTTLSLGNGYGEDPERPNASQAFVNIDDVSDAPFQKLQPLVVKSGYFTTRLLPDVEAPLLSVREVARRLGVAPYTVYRLCARGELEHVRVSNAIRVREGAVEEFVRRRVVRGR